MLGGHIKPDQTCQCAHQELTLCDFMYCADIETFRACILNQERRFGIILNGLLIYFQFVKPLFALHPKNLILIKAHPHYVIASNAGSPWLFQSKLLDDIVASIINK